MKFSTKTIMPLLALATPLMAAAQKEVKPNILWIITDDQRADALECWNRATRGTSENALGYVSSPNLDKLASEGVLFTDTYCNSPVSAPSRASMHTGRYPHHNGIYNFVLAHNENNFSRPLIPTVMNDAGYKTILFGKTGVRIFKYSDPMRFVEDPNHAYTDKVSMESDLERAGLADRCSEGVFKKGEAPGTRESWYYPDGEVVSFYTNRKGDKLTAEDLAGAAEVRERQGLITMPDHPHGEIIGGVNTMPTDRTLDGRIAFEVMNYLDHTNDSYKALVGRETEGPKSSQPQFLNVGFHFPHTPVLPSQEYRDQFMDRTYKVPEFDDKEASLIPKQLERWRTIYNITTLSDEDKQQIIRDYYAFCAMGDHLIGQTVDKFKAYCEENDQPYLIVIACGDHGWHLGEQGVSYKAANYAKSNQTALIVVSSDKKKYPAGKVVDDFVEYVDFAPTFFAEAGYDLSTPEFDYLDGRDIATTVDGAKPREYVLGETSVSSGYRAYLRGKDFAFSMRSRKPSYNPKKLGEDVKWALECTPREADMALFDLRVDPDERRNVAYDAKYEALADWFRQKLGNIVLGDGRVECDWNKMNIYDISTFAEGSDDKKLDIPRKIIPKVKKK